MEEHDAPPLVPERVVEATVRAGSVAIVGQAQMDKIAELHAQVDEMAGLMKAMKREMVEMSARQKIMADWSAKFDEPLPTDES